MPRKAIYTQEEYTRRFREKYYLEESTGCWIWLGALSAGKYGSFYYDKRMQKAHRVAYKLFIGPLDDNLELDHVVCHNTLCVNPHHCEAVTGTVNRQRTKGESMNKTHCKYGHAIAGDNEYIESSTGYIRCRECKLNASARYEQRHIRMMINGVRRQLI